MSSRNNKTIDKNKGEEKEEKGSAWAGVRQRLTKTMRRRAPAAEIEPCCMDWAMLFLLTTMPIKKGMQQQRGEEEVVVVEGGLKEKERRKSVRRAR